MRNKFSFLTKDSLKKKVCTKSFKIVNIVLFIVIAGLINLDSIVKSFGGDFDDEVNIYVVDEANVYDDVEAIFKGGYLDVLDSYNAKIEKSDKDIKTLEEDIKKDETKDIIVEIVKDDEKIFKAKIISYEYMDQLLYQNISNALNTVKVAEAMKKANISQELLNKINENIDIERVLLNEDLDENQELMEQIGGIIIIIFIVPFFVLILLIVQMIGAEINEEKRTKSMEVIISSVPAKTHFLSKLVAANAFAIIQGALLILYAIVGVIIRALTTTLPDISAVAATTQVDGNTISSYITAFLQSDVASRLVVGIPLFIILILLSFFLYSVFIGVLASVTTSMEDYQQIQTPVMIFLMIGYYLAIYASVYQGASFITVAAYVPFISGILAPVMYSLGQMSIIGLIISILLLAITCYLFYKYGLKIYKEGILNYESSKLWNKIFKSLKR